jgi:phospholipid transport system substrate-binding protein
MRARLAAMCALTVATAIANPGVAAAGDAEDTIRAAETEFRALLKESPEPTAKIEAHLRGLFDIREVARSALEQHWASMTTDQQDEVVASLRTLIERRYIASMRSAFDHTIEYKGQVDEDGAKRVRTVILETNKRGRTSKVSIDYVMTKKASGWGVDNMITDSVSLVDNYRSQFNRVIKKRGIDGLIAKLRAKAGSTD